MAEYRAAHNIPDFVEMYTPQAWYKQGYQVKKGSVCKHRIELYKDTRGTAKHTFKKWFSLFTRDQVESIK